MGGIFMKVVLAGAYGNLGADVFRELIEYGKGSVGKLRYKGPVRII